MNAAPDFRHVQSWVFDLDHTLYTTDAKTQNVLEERICLFVQRALSLAHDPAFDIQKRYLREHGSTLAGLVRNHGVDPDVYHDFINNIAELRLQKDKAIRSALQRLTGKRFVFTNNCGRFAAQVLTQLGVEDLFDGIVDAKAMVIIPKPNAAAYDTLLIRSGIDPMRAAMFDDSPRNLVPAKALGMITVWLNNGGGLSRLTIADAHLHIDHETDDLAGFLQRIQV